MTTTVTLSKERLNKAFLRIYSTPIPIYWCTLSYSGVPIVISLSFTLIHTHSATSSLESLSKIPSLPITIKSHSSGSKRNERISGIAITTYGFPPTAEILASRSPNVLHTESLPGRTLYGPIINSLWPLSVAVVSLAALVIAVAVLYL